MVSTDTMGGTPGLTPPALTIAAEADDAPAWLNFS